MGLLRVPQNKAAKVLLNLPPRSSSTKALDHFDLKTLSKRRHFHSCVMMLKYLSGEIDFKFDIRRNYSSFHFYHSYQSYCRRCRCRRYRHRRQHRHHV